MSFQLNVFYEQNLFKTIRNIFDDKLIWFFIIGFRLKNIFLEIFLKLKYTKKNNMAVSQYENNNRVDATNHKLLFHKNKQNIVDY